MGGGGWARSGKGCNINWAQGLVSSANLVCKVNWLLILTPISQLLRFKDLRLSKSTPTLAATLLTSPSKPLTNMDCCYQQLTVQQTLHSVSGFTTAR